MGRIQKIRMIKHVPRSPILINYEGLLTLLAHANKIENKSKSVRGINEKSNLLFCNMNTYGARKVKYEKVQVNTTQRDGGL